MPNLKDRDVPLMHSDIWCQVLRCFPFSQAVDMDMSVGGKQKQHLLVNYEGILNENSWMDAVESNTPGFVKFLIHYKIACPFWERLVERAATLNHFEILILLTSPSVLFYGADGSPFSAPIYRNLDVYFQRKGQENVARFFLFIYHGKETLQTLVKQPIDILQGLIRKQRIEFIKFIVPQHYRPTSFNPVELAMIKEDEELALYLLKHMDLVHVKEPPEHILVRASKMGMLNFIKYVVGSIEGPLPHQAIVEAFEHGHKDVYTFFKSFTPHFCPSIRMILQACTKGKEDVISLVPLSVNIPAVCMSRAIRNNGNVEMVKSLHKRNPTFRFSFLDFREAVSLDSEALAVYIYQCQSKRVKKKLNDDIIQDMIQKNMRSLLFALHADKVKVYRLDMLHHVVHNNHCDLFLDMIIQGQIQPLLKKLQELWDVTTRSYVNITSKSRMLNLLDKLCQRLYNRKVYNQVNQAAEPNRFIVKCADLCLEAWQSSQSQKSKGQSSTKRTLEEDTSSTDMMPRTKRSKNT